MKQGDSVHLEAFCPQCEATYYRTARPLIVGRDKLSPDLFVPVKEGTPPPNPDKPECPTCASPLRFINKAVTPASVNDQTLAEEKVVHIDERQRARHSLVAQSAARPALREVDGSSPSRGATVVDVLFAVEDGEQVLDMKDTGGSYLVVTNKRIIKVSYE